MSIKQQLIKRNMTLVAALQDNELQQQIENAKSDNALADYLFDNIDTANLMGYLVDAYDLGSYDFRDVNKNVFSVFDFQMYSIDDLDQKTRESFDKEWLEILQSNDDDDDDDEESIIEDLTYCVTDNDGNFICYEPGNGQFFNPYNKIIKGDLDLQKKAVINTLKSNYRDKFLNMLTNH